MVFRRIECMDEVGDKERQNTLRLQPRCTYIKNDIGFTAEVASQTSHAAGFV